MHFLQQLEALVAFHLEEHTRGRHLLQFLDEEDDIAHHTVPSVKGVKRSAFFEAIHSTGLEQLSLVFKTLQAEAARIIPKENRDLGDLTAIDQFYIKSVFSKQWADFSYIARNAAGYVSFDLNRSIPIGIALIPNKVADARPYVNDLFVPAQTAVMDPNYQSYKHFDSWIAEGKHFICRIRANSQLSLLENNGLPESSSVFYDAAVLLGIPNVNQTKNPVRVIGYREKLKEFWIATNRNDLEAEQVASAYKARWAIEKFFEWWNIHLKYYQVIARSGYGLAVQTLAGLVTYLLLAIYSYEHFGERVSIKKVSHFRIQIRDELLTKRIEHIASMSKANAGAQAKLHQQSPV